jgi:type IV pilus assembly protein PilQ
MKILLRLAGLSLCAALGILLAVQLAAHATADVAAKSDDAESVVRQEGSGSEQRHVPASARKAMIQPRTTADASRTARVAAEQAGFEPLHVAQAPTSGNGGETDAALQRALSTLLQQQGVPVAPNSNSATVPVEVMMKMLDQNEQTQKALQMLQAQMQAGGATVAQAPAAGPSLTPPVPQPPTTAVAPIEAPAVPTATATEAEPLIMPAPSKPEIVSAPGAVAAEGDGKLAINARDVDVRVLLEQLAEEAGMNILAGASVSGSISLNMQHVGVEQALDAILKATGFTARHDGGFVYIGTAEDFAAMERAQDRIGTRVYRPNYISAKELSTMITPLLSPTVGKISVSTPAATGIAVDNTTAGGDAMSQQDAIVVQDYETVLAQIDAVIKDLDRRPAQVSIEAMIVSVILNDANSFGVDFQVLRDQQNVRFGWGNPRQAPLAGGGQVNPVTGANVGQFEFDTGGLKFAFLDDSLGVFINALETVGDANVIASPKLLCLNKQKAEILIGQKLGYISTTVTQNFSTQNVEFLDVGAQLRLRPFISSDGLIRLEVHPELSEGQVVVNGGFTLPNKTLTEVTTNVMCPDGCTVILGGLMRENLRSNSTQVPLLGSLPGVGPLFRNKTENVERTEILILLTPRIVYDGDNAAEGNLYKKDAVEMEAAKFHRMSPVGKAHLARDYNDRARAAAASGNRVLAQRFARLAVHYDPLNRDAVRTLHEIGSQDGAPVLQGLGVETVIGEGAAPVVDGEMPPWMLEELAREDVPVPEHPRDPGVPGRSLDIAKPEVFRHEK